MRVASLGHAIFAAIMIALGIMGLIKGDFTAVWGGVPEHLPGRKGLAYVCAFVALACGLGLFWRGTAPFAARLLLVYLVLWLLVFKVQFIVRAPLEEVSYQTNGETAVIVAGAWVLYAWLASDWDSFDSNRQRNTSVRAALAAVVAICPCLLQKPMRHR